MPDKKRLILASLFISFTLILLNLNSDKTRYLSLLEDGNVYASNAAKKLPLTGRLFCWVMTAEMYYKTRVPAINSTWLKRCDHGEFFVTEPIGDESVPYRTAFRGFNDTYEQLFYKTVEGFYFAYTKVSNKFDWYYKVDDDTYVVVENLLPVLKTYNASLPYYLGYLWKHPRFGDYHSGGTGYLLSRGAVEQFVKKAYKNETVCPFEVNEDAAIARCLRNIGIKATFDKRIQKNFFPRKGPPSSRCKNLNQMSIHAQQPKNLTICEKLFYPNGVFAKRKKT